MIRRFKNLSPAAQGFVGAIAALALAGAVWAAALGCGNVHAWKVQSDQDHKTLGQVVDFLNKSIAAQRKAGQ
jgi:hypothetical protein